MKNQSRKAVYKSFIILSIIGILISLYLLQSHYAPADKGSICDFGESVSCSLVNTSVYSELFNVPVALFGVLWFVILIGLSWKGLKSDKTIPTASVVWSIVGLLSVIYLVIAEILLRSICPFCTVVHVIIITVLILSLMTYKSQKRKPTTKQLMKAAKPWIAAIIILNLIPLILFNLPSGEKVNHDASAQCITENGVNMYSSFRCGVCAKTRAMFGDSFQYINEIECHPQGENPQTDLCVSKKIEGTPTWILEPNDVEQKRVKGFLSVEELKQFAGCE
jgi:uncharacterized membrane protein